jgi:hypothetical protein
VIGGRATDDAAADNNDFCLPRDFRFLIHFIRVRIHVYADPPRR